jgi:hypothetical protein
MKMLCFFFVAVVFACAAPCQEVEIIGFDQSGLLAWSNSPPPLYCGVEANWNLRHTWLPLSDWNVYVTSAVTNGMRDIDLDSLWNAIRNINTVLGGETANGMFFRVVASPTPLGPRYATNLLQVTNAGTSVLDNVEIGLIHSWAHNPITNLTSLAQGAASPVVALVQEIPVPTTGTVTNIVAMPSGLAVQEGWYVAYGQTSSNRVIESRVIPFGEPEKNIDVSVSNESYTVTFRWLGLTRTFPY